MRRDSRSEIRATRSLAAMTTTSSLPVRLEALLGRDRIAASENHLRSYAVAGRALLVLLTDFPL